MATSQASEQVAQQPVILMIDVDANESYREFAGALRTAGLRVRHVVPPGGPHRSTATRLLDRWALGDSELLRSTLAVPSTRRRLLRPPTADLHTAEHVAAALTRTEEWAQSPHLHKVREDLSQDIVYDKLAVTRLAEEHGIGVPRTWTTPTTDRWPVVVKGREGYGGRMVRLAHDQAELDEHWAALGGPEGRAFLQEFHAGGVTSSGGVARQGEPLVLGSWKVYPSTTDPLGPPVRITAHWDQELIDQTAAVVAALGYTGIFNLNFVHDGDGKPLLIDLNCRVFGSWRAVQEAGLDIVGAYAALHGIGSGPRSTALADGADLPVLRLAQISGSTTTEVGRATGRASRLIWSQRDRLGWRWATATEARLVSQAVRHRASK